MKKLGLNLLLGTASLAGLMASTAAYADTDWGTVSAYVAVQSDYRFRGISQNNREPAEQASINWSGPDGFYAGTWVSKVDWTGAFTPFSNPTVEVDLYGGKHFDLDGTDLNVEAYYYAYPDANSAFWAPEGASYFEGIVQLSHTFGSLSLTATGAVSPSWSVVGGTAEYVEGTASYAINDWLSVSGNVGHQWVDNFGPGSDYTHFDLGLSATWRHFVLDVRANGTDMNTAQCANFIFNNNACTTGVVATLTYNIPDLFNP